MPLVVCRVAAQCLDIAGDIESVSCLKTSEYVLSQCILGVLATEVKQVSSNPEDYCFLNRDSQVGNRR